MCGSALFDFQPGTSYYFKIENCYYNTDIYSGYAVGNIVEGGTVCTKVEGKTSRSDAKELFTAGVLDKRTEKGKNYYFYKGE